MNKIQWYAVRMCEPCAKGETAECTTPGCALFARQVGCRIMPQYDVVAMNEEQHRAFETAKLIELGVW